MNSVEIWTDGACVPNPGKGGWAWIRRDGEKKQGSLNQTTNQRMELNAVVSALECHPSESVHIFTDSQYVIKGSTIWSKKWITRGWKRSGGKEVLHEDLWRRIVLEMTKRPVIFTWVKGHSGDDMNDAADSLANEATGAPREELEYFNKKIYFRNKRASRQYETHR